MICLMVGYFYCGVFALVCFDLIGLDCCYAVCFLLLVWGLPTVVRCFVDEFDYGLNLRLLCGIDCVLGGIVVYVCFAWFSV